MAFDWFSVATGGDFPTPTPTDAERASYFTSGGLWDALPEGVSDSIFETIELVATTLKEITLKALELIS